MTPNALIAELNRRGIEIGVRGSRLCCRPAGAVSSDMRALLVEHKLALIHLLTSPPAPLPSTNIPLISVSTTDVPNLEDGRRVRWTKADERGCRKCKRCGGPFIWGKVIEDSDPKAKRGAWMKLDPDLMPHGCGGPRAGRFIDPEPKPTDGATTHDDK